jgi:hypothetical protein
MTINWAEVQRTLTPLKDFEDLAQRFQVSFSYPFVRDVFNFTLPALGDYTHRLLGGDARHRYDGYLESLEETLAGLSQAGVVDVLDLVARTRTRLDLQVFTEQNRIDAIDVARLLKYLVYWFIPGEKYLSGLIRPDASLTAAIKVLGGLGLRTNLQLMQRGLTPENRIALAESSGLPEDVINKLVNIADLSRLPWSSKATIANIIGAGYPSLRALASADPEQLYADFFAYGASIGKNLKLGNEIENSYRIAKIVPVILKG